MWYIFFTLLLCLICYLLGTGQFYSVWGKLVAWFTAAMALVALYWEKAQELVGGLIG